MEHIQALFEKYDLVSIQQLTKIQQNKTLFNYSKTFSGNMKARNDISKFY